MAEQMRRILVLNPNSSGAVTESMRAACADLALPAGQELVFATLAEGPPGIETQRHVESVVLPTVAYFRAHPADAYVIGCFSDPGLLLAREELDAPSFGISESAILAATAQGGRFGIVAIKESSIRRHKRTIGALGVLDRLAGDRALDLGVQELLDQERSLRRVIEIGRQLRDEDGATVLILGCATMGAYCAHVQAELGLPVIDPTQAAVLQASRALVPPQRKVS
jgi:Asp/Glu/hydantoin racemase